MVARNSGWKKNVHVAITTQATRVVAGHTRLLDLQNVLVQTFLQVGHIRAVSARAQSKLEPPEHVGPRVYSGVDVSASEVSPEWRELRVLPWVLVLPETVNSVTTRATLASSGLPLKLPARAGNREKSKLLEGKYCVLK